MVNNECQDEFRLFNQENECQAAKNEILSVLFKGAVSQCVVLDRFSMWILAGTSVALTLLLSNFGKIIDYFSFKEFSFFLVLVFVSFIFAVFGKYCLMLCQAATYGSELGSSLEKPFVVLMNSTNRNEINQLLIDIFKDLISSAFFPARPFLRFAIKRFIKKKLTYYPYSLAFFFYTVQGLCIGLQVLFLLLSIMVCFYSLGVWTTCYETIIQTISS